MGNYFASKTKMTIFLEECENKNVYEMRELAENMGYSTEIIHYRERQQYNQNATFDSRIVVFHTRKDDDSTVEYATNDHKEWYV